MARPSLVDMEQNVVQAKVRKRKFACRTYNLFNGAEALTDHEIIEFLISQSSDLEEAGQISRQLMGYYGSFAAVVSAPISELYAVSDISDLAANTLKMVQIAALRFLKSKVTKKSLIPISKDLINYLMALYANRQTESCFVLYLDRHDFLISCECHSVGTIDKTPVYARELIKRGFELGALGLILVHNHPSGVPLPSQDDIELSREMKRALEFVSIRLNDHIIIGDGDWRSLRGLGLLD